MTLKDFCKTAMLAAGILLPNTVTLLQAQCVYVGNVSSNDVSAYRAGADGTLTPIGPPVLSGTNPLSIVAEPSGRFVFAGNIGSNTISAFSIGSNGALTLMGSYPAAGAPGSLAVHPSGSFLYVTTGQSLQTFQIASDGSLTPIGQLLGTSNGAQALAVDPAGKFLYIGNWRIGTIVEYSIASDGAPSQIGRLTEGSGFFFNSIATHPSSQFLYASYGSLGAYNIANDGTLAQSSTAPGTSVSAIVVEPTGNFLYAIASGGIWAYSIGSDGRLTPFGSPAPAGDTPIALGTDSAGKFLYVANQFSNDVQAYSIGRDGSLTPIGGSVPTGSGPYSVATSTCVGTTPPSLEQVSGAGSTTIGPDTYRFNFEVLRNSTTGLLSGSLGYSVDSDRPFSLTSNTITSLNIAGGLATFGGKCTDNGDLYHNGLPCSFSVRVRTNDPASFRINIVHEQSFAVGSGDIQISTASGTQ